MRVPADSWEADNWPTRKPRESQVTKKIKKEAERAAQRVATDVIRTAQRNATTIKRTIGTALGVGGSASATSIVGAAAGAIIAGIASYWGTTKLIQAFNQLGSQSELADWQLAVTNAWRSARREAEQKLQRSLTQAERNELRAQFEVYYKANVERSIRNVGIKGHIAAALRRFNIPI